MMSLPGLCTHSICTAKAEQDLEGHASEAVFKMNEEQERKKEEGKERGSEGGRVKRGGKKEGKS